VSTVRVLACVLALSLGCEPRTEVPGVPPPAAGQVVTATLSVTVVDTAMAAVPGVRLVPFPINRLLEKGATDRNVVEIYVTDASGKAEIRGLPVPSLAGKPIEYTVFAYASGLERGEVRISPLAPDERRDVTVRLVPTTAINTNRVALFDGENLARGNDFLVRSRVKFSEVTRSLATTDLASFDALVVGFDQSVNGPFVELQSRAGALATFVQTGGLLFLLQQNDFLWDPSALPVPVTLLPENAPLNDFETFVLRAPGHPLVAGITDQDLHGWDYIEAIKNTRRTVSTFDAVRATGLDSRWVPILTTPSAAEAARLAAAGISVAPESGVALAEARVGSGVVLLNQTSFYQASLGSLTTPGAVKLRDNLLRYLGGYKRP
jgi:hypothetical protein